MPLRSINIRTATKEEFDRWQAEYVAAVEDGSLRAEMDAEMDPEWVARYGDASWDAMLVVSGYCAPWDPILTHPEPRPKSTHQP
jgi:hypothetical protein